MGFAVNAAEFLNLGIVATGDQIAKAVPKDSACGLSCWALHPEDAVLKSPVSTR
jgi:hypothetical protein